MTAIPSFRSLALCWAALMALTIILLLAGEPTEGSRLPLLSVAMLLLVALLKARQILWVFLDLRRSTLMWKATFLAFLGTILAVVMGFSALATVLGR